MATKTPLRILLLGPLGYTEVEVLEKAGHKVDVSSDLDWDVNEHYDLVVGDAAWHLTNPEYLMDAVKAAQTKIKRRKK